MVELRVRTDVTVVLVHSFPNDPQSRLEVALEAGNDEEARPVADHPVVGHVKGVVELAKIPVDELGAPEYPVPVMLGLVPEGVVEAGSGAVNEEFV